MSLLFWIIASVIIGGAIVITISGIISSARIKEYLQHENYNYGRITKILDGANTISLEAFNQLGEKTDIEFKSEEGIGKELYEGMRF